jgi:phosphatidylglycerophosphate synthase
MEAELIEEVFMGLYILKFGFREVLKPLLKICGKMDPDILSYIAVIVAAVTGAAFYLSPINSYWLLVAIFLTFIRMILNTLDGVIAIEQKKTSLTGEIVNALPDRYSDIFVMLGLVLMPGNNIVLGILALISVFLVSYTGMLGKAVGVNWQHHGPLGKVERLLSMMIFSLAQFLFSVFGCQIDLWSWFYVWFIVTGQITVFNRLQGMLIEIRGKNVK